MENGIRIQKVLSEQGIASRRKVDGGAGTEDQSKP